MRQVTFGIVGFIGGVCGGCILPQLLWPRSNLGPLVGMMVVGSIGFGIGYFIGDLLEARKRKRESGCCPRCHYDLRGDTESGCPECGWNRDEVM